LEAGREEEGRTEEGKQKNERAASRSLLHRCSSKSLPKRCPFLSFSLETAALSLSSLSQEQLPSLWTLILDPAEHEKKLYQPFPPRFLFPFRQSSKAATAPRKVFKMASELSKLIEDQLNVVDKVRERKARVDLFSVPSIRRTRQGEGERGRTNERLIERKRERARESFFSNFFLSLGGATRPGPLPENKKLTPLLLLLLLLLLLPSLPLKKNKKNRPLPAA